MLSYKVKLLILLEREGAFMRRSARRFLSVFITISMILSLVPLNGMVLADAATVYYTDGADVSTNKSGLEGPVVAMIIDGGDYSLTETIGDDVSVIINNSTVNAGSYDIDNYCLLGNSSIDYGASSIATNNIYGYNGDLYDLEAISDHMKDLPDPIEDY